MWCVHWEHAEPLIASTWWLSSSSTRLNGLPALSSSPRSACTSIRTIMQQSTAENSSNWNNPLPHLYSPNPALVHFTMWTLKCLHWHKAKGAGKQQPKQVGYKEPPDTSASVELVKASYNLTYRVSGQYTQLHAHLRKSSSVRELLELCCNRQRTGKCLCLTPTTIHCTDGMVKR